MRAIISDVHANWEALQAVMHDIALHRVADVYCLGDLVGYGPDPGRCLDSLIHLELPLVLRGNHDHAVLGEATGFSPVARRALDWTRAQLLGPDQNPEVAERRRNFLTKLPETHLEGDILFVHGSPRDPLNEYVFPQDAGNSVKMAVLFWMIPRCGFLGHTHMPGIFTDSGHFFPAEHAEGYQLGREKIFCNVGSVGQSRDGDQRACYVLLDGDVIRFRRIEYDMAATRKKVRSVDALDDRWWR
jgi:predicted phosphodiesterase